MEMRIALFQGRQEHTFLPMAWMRKSHEVDGISNDPNSCHLLYQFIDDGCLRQQQHVEDHRLCFLLKVSLKEAYKAHG
jgi:hypothetical protein